MSQRICATGDIGRLIGEVQSCIAVGGMAMLDAGRYLCQIKKYVPRGSLEDCFADIGVSRGSARVMMRSARKFLNEDGQLKSERFLTLSSVSKFHELALLDDEALHGLAEGGSLGGATLDDIEAMTVRELREHIFGPREEPRAETAGEGRPQAPYNTLELLDEISRCTGRAVNMDWLRYFFVPSAGIRWTSGDLSSICAALIGGLQ